MKKDAKSRYSKITILVSLALVIAFVLCTLLVLPLFNKQEDFSDVVEGGIFDKNIRMVGDEPLSNDEAYFYETVVVPENSFGIGNHTIKEVNWSFFWKLFKNHAMWQLEAWHPVNLVWVDNWQGTNLNEWLNITRVRSSDNGSEKVTLNITNMHPSQDLFFRLKFGVDLPALEYINRSSWYEYEITYPCNQTENYTVFFNFSDIQPLVQDGVIIQRHGFTNYQGEDIFYFIISQNMSRNPLQHGNSFEIDPSFGGLNEEIVARGIGVASQFISGEYCWGLSASPASDGTGNYIMAYIKNDDVDDNLKIKGFLYDTTGDDDTVGVTEEVTINANTDYDWIRLNFTGGSPELSLSETYYISVYGEAPTYDTTTPHGTSITGDTGVNTTRNENWNNYPTYENPWVGGIVNTEFELSIYCVYNEVAGNNAPVNSNPEPNNANTSEPLNPTLNITVNDADGDTMNQSIWTNASVSWNVIAWNNNTGNTTLSNSTSVFNSYNTKYYWSSNLSDGTDWDNDTYYFTTIDFTPDAPVIVQAKNISSNRIDIYWTDDTEADSTHVEWDSSNDTSWNLGDHNNTGINSSNSPQQHTSLSADTNYYYKAWSWNITQGVWSGGSNIMDNITLPATQVGSLEILNPFPLNNSADVLTGIGNISVVFRNQTYWSITLYDNNWNNVSYVQGGSGNGIKYCDVTNALYYKFNRSFTWNVSSTNGSSWTNKSYNFDTFNGSGFIYIQNLSTHNDYNVSSVWVDYPNVYFMTNDADNIYINKYNIINSSLVYLNNATVLSGLTGKEPKTYKISGNNYLYVLYSRLIAESETYEIKAYDKGTLEYIDNYFVAGDNFMVTPNGTDDRIHVISWWALGIFNIECDGVDLIAGNFLDDQTRKVTSIGDYLVFINSSNDDIVLYDFNKTTPYQYYLLDTYAGTYIDVTNDGNYFYGISDTSLDIFSINETDELVLEYSYVDSGVSVAQFDYNSFIGSSDGKILSYLYEGGEFSEKTNTTMVNNSGNVYEMDGDGCYLVVAGEQGGLHLYGYELLRVAPPVINLTIAGNPSGDTVNRQGTIRYVNQSYNNETFCNITAEITVPDYRTLGRYFRTVDDNLFVATGNLSDGDVLGCYGGYADCDEGNHSIIASMYPCTYTGSYSQISAWIAFAGHNTANISYAIYDDDNGNPGNLLAFTQAETPGEETASYEPDINHNWYTLDIAYNATGNPIDHINLTEGQNYWLTVASYDNGGYIQDIYWVLGNSLGDTSYVRNSWYNISSDMNYSNISSPVWGTDGTNNATYLCIYAVAQNDTYNDITTASVTSAYVQFLNSSWETHPMSNYQGDMWTVNLTGLDDDTIWHTFNITAYDELGNIITYNHYRLLYQGWDNGWTAENIQFKTGVPCDYTNGNVSTDLYNNSYTFYLYDYFYDDTPDFFGDGEHMEHVLPHEQGVDGGANDTGRWLTSFPTDVMEERHCYDFSGGFIDENLTFEDKISLYNFYIHGWMGLSGHTIEWDRDAINFGVSNTTFDPTYLSSLGYEGNYQIVNFPTNSSTKETATVSGITDSNDDYERLICRYVNITENISKYTFDSNSIYQFFIGHVDNQSDYEWGFTSVMFCNRSYLTFVIFNLPSDDILQNLDSDGDTVSDYDELFVNWTHPFLNDTDGDGYNDSVDGQPNDYTESEFDWICMNLNTSEKFESIQNAIDDGDTLDTHIILIYEGTYNDSNIDVTKNLTFRGEKRETTVFTPDSRLDDVFIIYSQTKEYTVKIENLNITDCCGVSVMGKQTFTLSNVTFYNNDDNLYIWEYSTQYPQDIVISNCSFIKMNDMGVIIQTNDNGVQISNCTFDTCTANYFLEFEAGYRVNLRDTTFSNSSIGSGIRMASPVESTIDNITYNGSGSDIGIYVYDGSWDVNTISNSSISNCSTGIKIDNTYGGYTNTGYMIYSNNISNCSIGLDIIDDFDDSYPNMVYNNIFYGNTINANTTTEVYNISWNTTKQLGTNIIDGEYLGGNYWNDYTGVDTDEDGLGNTEIPYNSSGNITIGGDYLPLTGNLESTPELSSYSCSPTSGVDSYTTFWFNVTWADNEGQTPSDGYLSVNITKTGWYTNQTMNWISGDNTTGAQYSYNTTLTTGGDYNYTFYAYDGILYNSSGPYSNPTVVAQLMSISITQSSAPDANIWFNISKGLIPYYSNETNINASGQTSETPALAIQNTGNIPVNLTLYVNLSPLEGRTIKWDTDNNPTGATTVTESEVQIAEKLMMSDTKNIWLWMDFNSVTPDPPTGETKGRTITITSSSGYW